MTSGRDGGNPVQQRLRVLTTLVVLGVFVYLTVAGAEGRTTDDVLVIALALGAILVLLGYEGVVRLPLIGRDDREEKDD